MDVPGTDARAARAFIATAIAVGVAFALQVELFESARDGFVWTCAVAVLLGVAAWIYAAPALSLEPSSERETQEAAAPPARKVPLLLLGSSILALVAALGWLYVDLASTRAGWLWLGGLLGVLASVALLEYAPRDAGVDTRRRWYRAAGIGAVVLLALFLRTYRLEQIPAELVDDESLIAEWGMSAVHGTPIWDGSTAEHSTIFRKGGAAEPLPGCAIHAAVMTVAGETTFGLRLTAALAGAIGVGLLYLVLREFLAPSGSLAAAFLLAVCHTHLYWTRSGMLQALVTMVATGVILFTLRGLRSRGFLPWLIAGALLGSAQHLYEGGRFLLPILAPFFVILACTERAFVRRHGLHVGAMGLMSAAVFAPLGLWYAQNPETLLAVTHGAFIFDQTEYIQSRYPDSSPVEIVLGQLRRSLEGFAVHGDGGTFYPIWVPLFDPVVRSLVLAGILGFTLTLRPAYMLVSLWLWVPILIACTVTVDPPPMSRLMLALPALFAVAGAMIDRLGRLVRRGYGDGGRAVAALVGILFLAGAAVWNTDIFFVRYPNVFPVNLITASAVVAADAGADTKVYFMGPPQLQATAPTVRFLARGVPRDNLEADEVPVQELGRRDALFLVAADNTEALARLHEVYPGGEEVAHDGGDGNLLFHSYRVGRAELQRGVAFDATWREPDLRFGWSGDGAGEFSDPSAIVVDRDGLMYVADSGHRRIDVFDPSGQLLRVLGAKGDKAHVGEVSALAFEADGNLLALDRRTRWIRRLSPSGEILGRPIGGSQLLDNPVGIAAAADGTILVLDAGNHCVVRFASDGRELGRSGEEGSGPGQFEEPVAIAVADDGRVYVADNGTGRVQRFSPELAYETEWEIPTAERAPGQSLAAAKDGGVYVADPHGHRVQRFSPDGEKQYNVGAGGDPPQRLGWPIAVAVNRRGDVYVLDAERASVYRFDIGEDRVAP